MPTPRFAKTPKGIEEMTRRAHGLAQRARRALILIDGKRDAEALAGAFPDEDMAGVLNQLLTEGYIRELEPPPPAVAPEDSRPAPQTPIPRPADDGQRFDMARNFMINTTGAFLGFNGSGLIEKLEAADGLETLRQHYAPWRDAIRLTREGRDRIDELEQRLAALLS